MSEKPQSHILRIYKAKTWYRELWSDFCTFSGVVGIFAVGWWFDSSAMQWFGFVTLFIIILQRAKGAVKDMNPQEAADYIRDQFNVTAQRKNVGGN